MPNNLSRQFLSESQVNPSSFTFEPPIDCIAISSNTCRDECKLMILNSLTGQITHCRFKEIFNYFEPEDVIIFNGSTVLPSTVEAVKAFEPNSGLEGELKVKVTILNNQGEGIYEVKVDKPRRVRAGNVLHLGSNGLSAVVIDVLGQGCRTLRFRCEGTGNEIDSELQSICLPLIPDYSGIYKGDKSSSVLESMVMLC